MEPKRKVGIVGGAGPMAGAQLFGKIIEVCQHKYGSKEDTEMPWILMLSYPFPQMLRNPTPIEQQNISLHLSRALKLLKENGAEVVAVACNTLHRFLEPRALEGMTFIHLIDEVGGAVREKGISKSLVLCSTTSRQVNLHREFFPCDYPDANGQIEVQQLIDRIMAGAHDVHDSEKVVTWLNRMISDDSPRKGLVLGCTELSVLNNQFPFQKCGLDERFVIFDPIEIVAERICAMVFEI